MDERRSLDSDTIRLLSRNVEVLCLPTDKPIRLAYSVYNASKEALSIPSETGRTIFAEKFETNRNMNSLVNLSACALAKFYGSEALKISENNVYQRRLQLNAIDADYPLEGIYDIDDMEFWKRIALAKTKDAMLKLKGDDYDWKSEGITLKFVDLVEDCPAEFWPEAKMNNLIPKIKDYIKNMRIRKLQALQESTIKHYFQRDSDTDKSSTTDVSSTTEDEIEETEAAEGAEGADSVKAFGRTSEKRRSSWSFVSEKTNDENDDEYQESFRLVQKLTEQTNVRREGRQKRRQAQIERRQLREDKLLARKEQQNSTIPKKVEVENIYDLPVTEPINEEHKHMDVRNLQSYLKLKQKKIFTPDRCDHVDLSFIGIFDKLVSFYLEFKPPQGKYDTRYYLFSHNDIKNLANGIRDLKNLRIFRLRSSKMDYMMLASLVFALNQTNVEVIDFGNDSLNDECDMALRELFQGTTTIRSLEMEGNRLGVSTMGRLGKVLQRYAGKLQYLGLARNDIGNEGLHALLSKLAYQKQVESINLAGNKISEMAIWCCIADELLQRHKVLRYLDISGTPISVRGGEFLARTMKNNHTLLGFDCRGCRLCEHIETEIEIFIQRNRYMVENPYIGDKSRTPEEIEEFIRRAKNPVILKVEERLKNSEVCAEDLRVSTKESLPEYSTEPSVQSDDMETSESRTDSEPAGPFVYDVTAFDLDQIIKHVNIPGPDNRIPNFIQQAED